MEKQIFFILLTVCIITHIVRSIYEILKHKKIVLANNLTFAIIFTNMALLWTTWIAMCRYDIYKIELPVLINYFGALLFFTGLIVFITALLTIKTLESYAGDLITKGIYSKIRHPMYLGFILWLIGFPIYFGALLSFCFSLLFISNILFWRHLEEIELEERFPNYNDYRQKTFF